MNINCAYTRKNYMPWIYVFVLKWSEVKWSEAKRSEVKWSEVKWSEVKWVTLTFLGTKVPWTLGWPYTEGTWLYCDHFIWCVSCTVVVLNCFVMCVCVCVGFVMCGCVCVCVGFVICVCVCVCVVCFVMCECFGNMCTCVTVFLYCFFMYIYSYLLLV